MKLTVFILLFGLSQLNAAHAFSQNQLVNLKYGKISFEKLLWEIEKQTGIVFMYAEDDIRDIRDLSVNARNKEALDVIKSCLKGTDVEMKIMDDAVVFHKREISGEPSSQPSKVVSGKISDKNGLPLPGATILIKNSLTGVTTDNDGRFTLQLPDEETTLVISFVGFRTVEVGTKGKETINIALDELITNLTEVMVVSTGYQNLSRERLSGSFETIDGKVFKERPNADIASSLEGMVNGFQRVVKTNPDGSITYDNRVRGQGTLTEGISDPLIVVDGFPVEDTDFSTIDPNTVESVTILKDAAAASIWGARAANGVIVITTKSGKGKKKFEVETNAFVRISTEPDLDYVNPTAGTETQLAWEKYVYDHKLTGNLTPAALGEVTISLSPSLTLYNEYKKGKLSEADYNAQVNQLKQYNYQDDVYEYLLKPQMYQQYDVAVTGSSERNNYSFSVMHDRNKSHFIGDEEQKTLISFKDIFTMNHWLRLNVGATLGLQNNRNEGVSLSDINRMAPYQRLVDEEGAYVPMVKDYYLPILDQVSAPGNFPYKDWSYNLLQEKRASERESTHNTIRLQGGVNMTLLKGLTLDSKIQYEQVQINNQDIYSEMSYLVRNQVNRYNTYDPATGKVNILSADGYAYPKGSALDRASTRSGSYVLRNQLQFDKDLSERHHLIALAGSEISSYVSDYNQQIRVWGYDDEKLLYPNQPFYDDFGATQFYTTAKTRLTPGRSWLSTYRDNRFFSLFGNFAYTFDQKYTLTGSVRTDASNMIVKDPKYRYAPFWSVGTRWAIHSEDFMQNIKWINRLQMRASYGVLGNVVTSTSVVPLISYVSSPSVNTQQYYARVVDFGNPLLRWEKTKTLNVGIDYALLNNQLTGKLDFYSKQSEDVLAEVDIAGAYGLGYSNAVNAAGLSNSGFELEVATKQQISRDLSWKGRFLLSHNKNIVKKLDVYGYYPARIVMESVFVQDKPLSPVYSYVYKGEENGVPMIRFENDQETNIFNIPTVRDARSFMQYEGTLVPTTEVGFNNDFAYRGFTLSALVQGRFGHVFRTDSPGYPTLNNSAMSTVARPMEEVINGTSDKFPGLPSPSVPDLSAYSIVQYFNTLVEDASNIRLREVTLSYTIPSSRLQALNISDIRLYSQVNNLGILWKATDTYYDPDFPKFKAPVSYLFGINVTF